MPDFNCNLSAPSEPFSHFWEHTIGSGHATLALRADWQGQLRRCHEELGMRHVRFHGLLDDDMGTYMIVQDKPLDSFFNADQIFDFLLSIGMRPFVELSFMPSGLASGDKTVFHYAGNVTPPQDYTAWGALIGRLARHWVDRYGLAEVSQWFFEVWNEPNLEWFGTGRFDDYMRLYAVTAKALKDVDATLKVGGPSTAANAWITEFVGACNAQSLPLDFVTTHHYPTDAFGQPGDDTETQLAASRRSVLREQAATAKAEAGNLPLYYTEWCTSSNPRDPLHDMPYAAAFIVKTVMEAQGLVQAYSYWTFSDIFEENYFPSVPFHGGFGLLNLHGIAKPAYRAFELLHGLGDIQYAIEGNHPTVDIWIIGRQSDNTVTILACNAALPRHPVQTETVSVTLTGANGPTRQATITRIDDDHANARDHWIKMGSPDYLKPADVAALMASSALKAEPQAFTTNDNRTSFTFTLPPQGIAAIKIEFGA